MKVNPPRSNGDFVPPDRRRDAPAAGSLERASFKRALAELPVQAQVDALEPPRPLQFSVEDRELGTLDAQAAPSHAARGAARTDGVQFAGGDSEESESGDSQVDRIRERFPEGILVALSVGEAYQHVGYRDSRDHPDEVVEAMDDTLWESVFLTYTFNNDSSIAEELWPSVYADLEEERQQYYGESFEEGEHQYSMARKVYDECTDDVQERLTATDELVTELARMARQLYVAEHEIVSEAQSFAADHDAIKGDEGSVVIGEPMYYRSPDDLASRVIATHDAVLELLSEHSAPTGDATETDDGSGETPTPEQMALVKYLSIAAHGLTNKIFGKGGAGGKIEEDDLQDLAQSISGVATHDIRVRLFACSTGGGEDQGEGNFADELRDQLIAAGLVDASVIAHEEAGHTTTNQTLRLFQGLEEGGVDIRMGDVFPSEFAVEEMYRLGVVERGEDVPSDLVEKFRSEDDPVVGGEEQEKTPIRMFLSRDVWMEADLSSLEAFRDSAQRLWRERVGPSSAEADEIRLWLLEDEEAAQEAADRVASEVPLF